MNKKKLLLSSIIFLLACIALYGFKQYYRRNSDLVAIPPELLISDNALIRSFTSGGAGNAYIGHILLVQGTIRKIENDGQGHIILVLGSSADPSAVRCSIDSVHTNAIAAWQKGFQVSVKGLLVGFNPDETGLLGSDVELNRCVPVMDTRTSSNK